jgi:hypothetical protein
MKRLMAGLEHLKGLAVLEELDVRAKQVTDAGLEHLAGLRALQTLDLRGAKITDAGLEKRAAAIRAIDR